MQHPFSNKHAASACKTYKHYCSSEQCLHGRETGRKTCARPCSSCPGSTPAAPNAPWPSSPPPPGVQIMPYHATSHPIASHHVVSFCIVTCHRTISYHPMSYCDMPHDNVSHKTASRHAISFVVQWRTMPYHTIRHGTVPQRTMWYSTVQ